jgi:hypothetical protein
MCNKPLRELTRRCPSCQADLDLLVDYGSFLSGGLQRADNLVKAGDLSQAIWAYLEVLEVDPDNPAARKQIGQVVTAVRQFDQQSPLRRMGGPSLNGAADRKGLDPQTVRTLAFGIVVAVVFTLGLLFGFMLATPRPSADEPPPQKTAPALGE